MLIKFVFQSFSNCDKCSFTTTYPPFLEVHHKECGNTWTCPKMCGKIFGLEKSLERHILHGCPNGNKIPLQHVERRRLERFESRKRKRGQEEGGTSNEDDRTTLQLAGNSLRFEESPVQDPVNYSNDEVQAIIDFTNW